jgi:hypothetical protein
VPFLRRLIAGLSPRRLGFDKASVTLRFVVDKVALVGCTENTSAFPCQYHSTDAQYSPSTPYCSYEREKKAKSGKLQLKVKVKVKVNFTLEQATKTQRGSRSIALLFL